MRANESMAMFMDEQDAIRDREQFVWNLGELLSQTRDGVVSCEIATEYGNGYEFVEILKGYPGEWESIAQSW